MTATHRKHQGAWCEANCKALCTKSRDLGYAHTVDSTCYNCSCMTGRSIGIGVLAVLIVAITGTSVFVWRDHKVAFSASPTSGSVPLSVLFIGRDGSVSDNLYLYEVDFGDGTMKEVNSSLSEKHSYKTPGNYIVKFGRAINECYGSKAPCTQPQPANWEMIAAVTVLVLSRTAI